MNVQGLRRNLRITRRRFVRVLTGAGAASVLGAAAAFIPAPWRSGDRTLRAPGRGSPLQKGLGLQDGLSEEELAELSALAAILHPPEDDRERRELDGTIRWWAAGRASRGGRLPLYRDGLGELEQTVRQTGHDGSFRELPTAARRDLVAGLHDSDRDSAFLPLAAELLEGVYATAIGWRVVGYRTAPGTPSGVLRYTRPPAPAPDVRPASVKLSTGGPRG